MKPKTMVLMVVAVACGLGASYMTSRLLAERGNATEEQPKIAVLVAKKNLDTGMILKLPGELFEEKLFTKGEEPTGAIVKVEELKNRVLKRSLRTGDWVGGSDLLSDKESLMQYLLPKGHMAYGLRVNIESIAGGFASLPLSRVDIYSTVRRGDDKGSFCQLLLQNVLVLAADQAIERNEKGAMPATTVTVALTPDGIQKVNLAKEFGPLSLVLRPFNDNQKLEAQKLTYEELLTGRKAKDVEDTVEVPLPKFDPKTESPVQGSKTRTHVVTVLNDNRQEQVEFTLDENGEVLSSRVLQREGAQPSLVSPPPPPLPMPTSPKTAENKQGENS